MPATPEGRGEALFKEEVDPLPKLRRQPPPSHDSKPKLDAPGAGTVEEGRRRQLQTVTPKTFPTAGHTLS